MIRRTLLHSVDQRQWHVEFDPFTSQLEVVLRKGRSSELWADVFAAKSEERAEQLAAEEAADDALDDLPNIVVETNFKAVIETEHSRDEPKVNVLDDSAELNVVAPPAKTIDSMSPDGSAVAS